MKAKDIKWRTLYPEALLWVVALVALAIIPIDQEAHFTLCPLSNFGFDFCPGCGLGRSISLAFNGQLEASFKTHPLGLLAIIILSYRIVTLTFYSVTPKN